MVGDRFILDDQLTWRVREGRDNYVDLQIVSVGTRGFVIGLAVQLCFQGEQMFWSLLILVAFDPCKGNVDRHMTPCIEYLFDNILFR